jgi:hypothetical protein
MIKNYKSYTKLFEKQFTMMDEFRDFWIPGNDTRKPNEMELNRLKRTLMGKEVSFRYWAYIDSDGDLKENMYLDITGKIEDIVILVVKREKTHNFLFFCLEGDDKKYGVIWDSPIIIKTKKIISEVDPYGEEDWDD